jgi:Mn2+/Fe2+ NRAMP family transporter
MKYKLALRTLTRRLLFILAILGPGLITASADNDASGIATYSLVGSHYGYRMLWVVVAVTIGEVVVAEMGARMGAVTGKGTADLIRENFSLRLTLFAMLCLVIANLGTTVGQFAGIAAGGEMLGISRYITVPIAALLLAGLVILGSYFYVEKFLLALSLFSLCYVASAIMAKPDWGEVLRDSLLPHVEMAPMYILTILATVGTTITPWGICYVQSSVADKGVKMSEYKYTRLDVAFGAAWGNVVSAFIIIATAATLFSAGIRVESAEQAALALEPLMGAGTTTLFAVGLLGASLLAGSVLPLATAYSLCEAFGWERGLNNRLKEAPVYYGIFAGAILVSCLIILIPGIPLFPVMWLSQTLNAIFLPVLLVLVLKLINDKHLMGEMVNSKLQNTLAIFLTVVISAVTILLLVVS